MFEVCLHEDIFDGEWLVIAFYLLWQSYEFLFEGTFGGARSSTDSLLPPSSAAAACLLDKMSFKRRPKTSMFQLMRRWTFLS